MSNLITVSNVRGYIDKNGTAHLNLEDISRGLGFTQEKNGTEYVRWETVFGYLSEFGFSQQVGKEGFIPENIFYRLAMKARNEVAEKFQAKVADEILPSIRKTGSYSIKKPSCVEDLIIMQAQSMKELRAEVKELKEESKQLADTTQAIKDTIITQPDNWREELNKMFNKIAISIGNNEFQNLRTESYKLLEERARVNLTIRLSNYKTRLFEQGASKTQVGKANKLDVIEQDVKLREIYAQIIKEYYIKHVA